MRVSLNRGRSAPASRPRSMEPSRDPRALLSESLNAGRVSVPARPTSIEVLPVT